MGNKNIKDFWIKKINNQSIISFEELKGGVSSDVYKVKTSENTYCVKRSVPKLRVKKEWYADTKRLKYEFFWLSHCKKIIPNRIPYVYNFIQKKDYLILEYFNNKKFDTLKSHLLNKKIEKKIIIKISKDLFKIHKESSTNTIKKKFINNSKNFYDLRLDAYFNELARVYPKLKKKVKNVLISYEKNSSTLVHGDFSPKNILVSDNKIKYIDAETSNFGDPAFDVVFFSNHLLIKSIFIPSKKKEFINCYKKFFYTYLSSLKKSDKPNFFNRCAIMIPLMLLARIDGKSPVEYIVKDKIKNKIRLLSFRLIKETPNNLENLIKKIT